MVSKYHPTDYLISYKREKALYNGERIQPHEVILPSFPNNRTNQYFMPNDSMH